MEEQDVIARNILRKLRNPKKNHQNPPLNNVSDFCLPGFLSTSTRGRGRGRGHARGSSIDGGDRRPSRSKGASKDRGLLGTSERSLGDPETDPDDSGPENMDEMKGIYRGLKDVVGVLADQVREMRIEMYKMKKER